MSHLLDGALLEGSKPANTAIPSIPIHFNPLVYQLPRRCCGSPPVCGKRARNVRRYMEEMEDLGRIHGMDGSQIIGMVFYYANVEQRILWSTVDSAEGRDWQEFKCEVLKLYPEAFFKVGDLADLAGRQINRDINEESLRNYYAGFLIISKDVQAQVSEQDLCDHFKAGFPSDLRKSFDQRMNFLATIHDVPYLPSSLNFIFEQALFVLSSSRSESGSVGELSGS